MPLPRALPPPRRLRVPLCASARSPARSPAFALLLALAAVALLACEATPGMPLSAPSAQAPEAVEVRWSPPASGGLLAPVVRATMSLNAALPADGLRAGRSFVVRGGVDATDLAELGRGRTTGALAGRVVPHLAWGAPSAAPAEVSVQPLAPLDAGPFAIVLLRDRGAPLVVRAAVTGDATPLATRVYPPAGVPVAPKTPWIFCLGVASAWDPRAPLGDGTTAPDELRVRAARLEDAPCAAIGAAVMRAGTFAPPPFVEGLGALDPGAVVLSPDAPLDQEASCAAGELPLGLACLRLDDDRVILAAGPSPSFAHGAVGGAALALPLAPRDRAVVRGLQADAPLEVRLAIEGQGSRSVQLLARTSPAHAHLVVNEALSHPPSGAASQRFLELVNDGASPLELAGLTVRDGDVEFALPAGTLPTGGYLLLLPEAYVDGLGGEEPPAPGALRLYVDALKLTSELAVVDEAGVIRSRLPGSSSTRTASRGRSAPERPDDAADAFGWDAAGRATPGRANAIAR